MAGEAWMLYGASGHTGRLIAAEAVRRGRHPILAGRSAEKLAPLAESWGLEWLALDLSDAAAVMRAVERVGLVFNAASPFTQTSAPLVRAALTVGASYADIANEIVSFQLLSGYDAEARRKGVALMTGAGFGVVAADTLAKYVTEQLPNATRLDTAIVLYTSSRSAGATRSGLELLKDGGYVVRDGRLVPQRLGAGAIRVPFPDGTRVVVPAPLGELEALRRTTGVPNITVYSSLLPGSAAVRALLPAVGQTLKLTPVGWLVDTQLARQEQRAGESAVHRETGQSYIWTRAVDKDGASAEAWLEMGEGYLYSAAASVHVAEALLTQHPIGMLTPAQAFGADFGLDIPHVRRLNVRQLTAPETVSARHER